MALYKISKRRAFLWIGALFTLALFWYLITPNRRLVSLLDFYVSFGFMLTSTWVYFRAQKKKNYFDFDTLFVCMFFFVGFFSTFFYNHTIYSYLFLHFEFDDFYLNAATWLFVLGIQAYYLGRLSKVNVCRSPISLQKINSSFLASVTLVLMLLFWGLGGLNYYQSIYDKAELTANGIVVQIEILLTCCVIAIVSTELYNKKINPAYPVKWYIWIGILVYSCLLLLVGNRTTPSFFILASIGLYSLLFKAIKLKLMVLLLCGGFVGMWGLTQLRSGINLQMVANAALYATDMTINGRNTCVAMDYVDNNDYTYGKTMLSGPLAIIPMSSYILNIDKNEIGSAELLTNYSYAHMQTEREEIGLGTNIIADLYISFGLLGVLVLMYILGYLINKYTKEALQMNYYSIIIYSVIMAYSVYGIRTGFTHPCRMLVWSLIIAYLNKSLTIRKLCRK